MRELDQRQFAWRIAAVREAFEESGVLLARPRGATQLLSGASVAQV